MPIYEYKCENCNSEFEVEQKITAAPGADCPNCGGQKVRRLISSTAFHLKGSGWYVTDYGSKRSGSAVSSPCAGGSCPVDDGGSCPPLPSCGGCES